MPTVYKRKPGSSRGSWNMADMEDAVNAIRNKEIGLREAARRYNVPVGTLHRKVSSEKPITARLGPKPLFGPENEKKLADHLQQLGKIGFPLARPKVRMLAFEFAEKLGIKHTFNRDARMAGYDWFKSFMRRNPNLSIRKSEGLSIARAQGLNREEVNHFYDLLTAEINKYNLQNKPQSISNCDESGIQLINGTGKVVTTKGARVVPQVTTGERGETITILACCTAEGRFFPPLLIMKGKKYKEEYADGLPPGSRVYMNEKSAYINNELFLLWFKQEFVPRKASGRNILILDGHCSHCSSIELLEVAEENDVSLLCLPPHTTHVLQPLDKSFFGPFKTHFRNETCTWVNQHVGRKLTRYQVGSLVTGAWSKAASVQNATSGFASCGIFPFNRYALPDHMFIMSDRSAKEAACNDNEDHGQQLPLSEPTPNVEQPIAPTTSSASKTVTSASPTKVLADMSPLHTLPPRRYTTRSFKGAVLLTSKSNRDKVRAKKEKKEKDESNKQKKVEKKKTRLVQKKPRLFFSNSEDSVDDDSPREEETAPTRKQPTRQAKATKKKAQ